MAGLGRWGVQRWLSWGGCQLDVEDHDPATRLERIGQRPRDVCRGGRIGGGPQCTRGAVPGQARGVFPLHLYSSYFQSCPRLQLPVLGKPHPTQVPAIPPSGPQASRASYTEAAAPSQCAGLQLPDPGPAAARYTE